ncbi:MAG TPA: hypothetical protein DEP19_08875 [Anaerolineae bacterium]|nr:hypothetical protein [Anaerolineae bacterium]
MKKYLKNFILKSEKGQAIILIAFAFVGLIAMVGLVTDTGLLLIEYGKLKRSVDAAAIGAAQQYRVESGSDEKNKEALENAAINFLNLNQVQNISNVIVNSCEDTGADRPALCNPDPVNKPMDNRKLVQVTASSDVRFGFLRVLGFESITLTATSVGEAVTLDLVLILDTSAQMSYETGSEGDCTVGANPNTCLRPEADDDPRICNLASAPNDKYPSKPWIGTCQPLLAVKEVALEFIETMYFPYDRAAIITFTSQTPGGDRTPVELMPLTSDKDTIIDEITNIKVFEPQLCDGVATPGEGSCIRVINGNYINTICEIFEVNPDDPDMDPSSCPSSNIGGTLVRAANALQGSGDTTKMRPESFWVVLLLSSGPANATDPDGDGEFPYGYCPRNTWPTYAPEWVAWCRDAYPSTRHDDNDVVASYYYPPNNTTYTNLSIYDADDYARDMADQLASLISPQGVTIYTIGLGAAVDDLQQIAGNPNVLATNPDTGELEPPPAEALLEYIAEEAGGPDINHGQYFFAPDKQSLSAIFDRIAKNIATKISQ